MSSASITGAVIVSGVFDLPAVRAETFAVGRNGRRPGSCPFTALGWFSLGALRPQSFVVAIVAGAATRRHRRRAARHLGAAADAAPEGPS